MKKYERVQEKVKKFEQNQLSPKKSSKIKKILQSIRGLSYRSLLQTIILTRLNTNCDPSKSISETIALGWTKDWRSTCAMFARFLFFSRHHTLSRDFGDFVFFFLRISLISIFRGKECRAYFLAILFRDADIRFDLVRFVIFYFQIYNLQYASDLQKLCFHKSEVFENQHPQRPRSH